MELKKQNEFKARPLDNFGERVNHILANQRLTKTWLANKLNLSKQNINYLLHYSSRPRHLKQIAELLDVSQEWLQTGNGPINKMSPDGARHYCTIPIFGSNQLNDFESSDYSGAKSGLLTELNTPKNAFAVLLERDLGEQIFRLGNILIFNPDLSHADQNYSLIRFPSCGKVILHHPTLNQRHLNLCDPKGQARDNNTEALGVLIEVRIIFTQPRPKGIHEIRIPYKS